MRRGQEAARRFHEEPERSSDFLSLPDLEDFLFKNYLILRSQKLKNENIFTGKNISVCRDLLMYAFH